MGIRGSKGCGLGYASTQREMGGWEEVQGTSKEGKGKEYESKKRRKGWREGKGKGGKGEMKRSDV